MMSETSDPILSQLGVHRVVSPPGALPQSADRVDPSGPVRAAEMEIDVESLYLDSTSFRQLCEQADNDPTAVAQAITRIIERRGKMHNPETGSGGILVGTVTAVGEAWPHAVKVGDRVVSTASLTLTPLRVATVGPIDLAEPRVPVTGTAYVSARAPWAHYPQDLELPVALGILDVCGAPFHIRNLAGPGDTVLVLGGGHAGLLSLAAARDSIGGEGQTIVIDANPDVVDRARNTGLADLAIQADLRDGVAALNALNAAGGRRADVTVVVVNATRCEEASILLTADDGKILFFSMATSFTSAALAAEGMGSGVSMFVGSGYAPDSGQYALDLVRANPQLHNAFRSERATR